MFSRNNYWSLKDVLLDQNLGFILMQLKIKTNMFSPLPASTP